ncbi:unnamed protein product, partial [Pylaiella littoralis]
MPGNHTKPHHPRPNHKPKQTTFAVTMHVDSKPARLGDKTLPRRALPKTPEAKLTTFAVTIRADSNPTPSTTRRQLQTPPTRRQLQKQRRRDGKKHHQRITDHRTS